MVMKICRMNNIKEELETLSFRYVPLRKRYAKLYQVFFYCYCFLKVTLQLSIIVQTLLNKYG